MASVDPRMSALEMQVRAIMKGERDYLSCPFCGQSTPRGEMLCCDQLSRAAHAVVDRLELNDALEHAERVAEKAGRN